MSAPMYIGGRIVFHDGDKDRSYSMPDPDGEELDAANRRLVFDRTTLSASDAVIISACVGAYKHFAAYPAATSGIIQKLRELRRAVKERRKGERT